MTYGRESERRNDPLGLLVRKLEITDNTGDRNGNGRRSGDLS